MTTSPEGTGRPKPHGPVSERFMRQHYGPSGYKEKTVIEKGTEEKPVYRAVEEGKGGATKTYMIVVDEGWRESIVCNGMYDWAAMWLVNVLQDRRYAPGARR